MDLPGYNGVPTLSGNSLKAAWTPDGSALVFSATTNLHQAAHARVVYHLYLASLEGGEPSQLTESMDWSCTDPVFTDKGDSLFCSYSPENAQVYNLEGVGRFEWSGGQALDEPTVVTRGFDRSVEDFALSENG